MKLQYLFYVLAIIFLFATIIYFAYEYLATIPKWVKTLILVLLIIVFFFIGEFMKERDV